MGASPESILNAAVIGLGAGARHAQAFADIPETALAALCDTDELRLREVGARYPGAHLTTDWRDIVRDPKLHLVSVCTPDHLHYEHASALVRSGKHVLCEKPMTTSLSEAQELVALVHEHGVALAVGNVLRYVPQFALALDYARCGKLGELFLVEGDYVHDMRPVFRRTPWRVDPDHPQNAIFGGGVHPIDLLRKVGGNAVEVFAYGSAKTLPEYNAPDSVLISIKFENGCLGKVWVTFGVQQRPHNRVSLNIYGDRGSVQADSLHAELKVYVDGAAPGQTDWATIPLEQVVGHPVRAELENLVETILCGRPPRVGVVDGARTVAVMAAAQDSLERGIPVAVPEIQAPRSLRMLRPTLADPPSVDVPSGYGLRTFRPGDERHWLRICEPEFTLGWDAGGLHEHILDAPWFRPEHMFFVTRDDVPVGVAAAWRREPTETVTGTLHFIAVQPEHRGHGLGRVLLGAVLRELAELGFQQCDLSTNDFRWQALGLYWRHGFRPQIETDLDRRRWATIERRLQGKS